MNEAVAIHVVRPAGLRMNEQSRRLNRTKCANASQCAKIRKSHVETRNYTVVFAVLEPFGHQTCCAIK